MNIQGIIFDADGTLLDSMEFWDNTVYDLLAEFGVAAEDDLIKILTPMSMYEGAVYLKNKYSLDVSPEEFIERENRIVERFYSQSVKLKRGVKELLLKLSEMNIPMSVASATDRDLIEHALRCNGILDFFKAIVSCSDVGEGKSSPAVYHKARSYLGTTVSATAVIEDSPKALNTAKQAGYITVGAYDKAHSEMSYEDICDVWLGNEFKIEKITQLL